VVRVKKSGMTNLGDVPVAKGTHSVAVDSDSQTVWISYSDDSASYLEPMSVAKVASAQ
jgi:hypothetical protein